MLCVIHAGGGGAEFRDSRVNALGTVGLRSVIHAGAVSDIDSKGYLVATCGFASYCFWSCCVVNISYLDTLTRTNSGCFVGAAVVTCVDLF
jgi:hypothetical protein